MMVARVVKYDEEGNIVYDGPAKRQTDQQLTKRLPFGLVIGDIFKIGAIIIACIVFIVKTDQRIEGLEESVKYLTTFAKNSDGFNSSIFGTQFEGGRPINNTLNLSRLYRNEKP